MYLYYLYPIAERNVLEMGELCVDVASRGEVQPSGHVHVALLPASLQNVLAVFIQSYYLGRCHTHAGESQLKIPSTVLLVTA